jgi:hypothetical protein
MPHKKKKQSKFHGFSIPYQGTALVSDEMTEFEKVTLGEMNAAAKEMAAGMKMLGSAPPVYTAATDEQIAAAQAKIAKAPPFPSYAPLFCPCCASPLMFSNPMGALRCSCGTLYISESEMYSLSTQPGSALLEALRLQMHDAVEKALHGTMKALVAAYGKAPPPPNVSGVLLGEADPFEAVPKVELIAAPMWTAKPPSSPFIPEAILKAMQIQSGPKVYPEPKKLKVSKESLHGFDELSPALQEFFNDFIEQPK